MGEIRRHYDRALDFSSPRRVIVLVLAAASAVSGRAQLSATIDANSSAIPVARGFAGCSVEMSTIGPWSGTYLAGSPALFDQSLVNLLNLLGQYEGPPVIRVGGNSQDRSWLQAADGAVIPPFNYAAAPTPNAYTPNQINALAWVQRLTGAPFTIGLNMGGDLPAEALEQMLAFKGLFDANGIAAFDIGNEPDVTDFASYRPAGWNESLYQADLVNFLNVLVPAAPGTSFAGPAAAGTSWLPTQATNAFNSLLSATSGRLAFVTVHHYIANGEAPPADPIGSLFAAANSSGIAASYAATQAAAAAQGGLPVRINETNTFYNGGLAGVSNAMASALWVADVLGSYAKAGMAGANFHGGASGPYTPFTMTASASGITVQAQPVYYGMMLFAQFIQNGAGLLPSPSAGVSADLASVYASRDNAGALRVLVINKSQTAAVTTTLALANLGGRYQAQGKLLLLLAPSLSATSGLTLNGQSYDGNGNVVGSATPTVVPAQPAGSSNFAFSIPAGSAGIFVLEAQNPVSPAVTVQATAATVNPGGPVAFTASAAGSAPFAYQWLFNGAQIPGATSARFVVPAAQPSDAGSYAVTVSNPAGSVTSTAVSLAVQGLATRLINVSSRAQVLAGASPLTVGFVIGGTQSRTVLIRAAGPALTTYGISSPLPHPSLTLFSREGYQFGANTGWASAANASAVAAAAAAAGAFPFAAGSADSAILATLAPGAYTAQVVDSTGASGTVLLETYQADSGFGTGRLINLSTRANVGTGANALTSGFVVSGPTSKSFLVRAAGPALGAFGVSNLLAAPVLQIYGSGSSLIASNTGWDRNGQGSVVAAAAAATGAFAFPAGSADSALVIALPPGAYTAQVSGANGTTGTALVEVYEIPGS
jgi:hypothetical protein